LVFFANFIVVDRVVTNPVIANSASEAFCESGNPREYTYSCLTNLMKTMLAL